ncbi:MAG: NAD+ synthase [Actinobacteria bacterium]|nr:NAD+ synthase [Actinomycetota bacterium]
MRVAMGQISPAVGDIDGNVELILDAWRRAADAGADLVVFTELAITGYPPEDLLLKPEFIQANIDGLHRLRDEGPAGTVAVVGYVGTAIPGPDMGGLDETVSARDLRNSAAVIADGRVVGTYNKWRLPNYGVFDEARYFVADDIPLTVRVRGVPVGVTICEDLWTEGGAFAQSAATGAKLIVSPNASPYHRGKRAERMRWIEHHASEDGVWIAWVNQVGGHDDVVFDGDSVLARPDGSAAARAAQFRPDLVIVDVDIDEAEVPAADLPGFTGERPELPPHEDEPRLDELEEIYEALVLATRDYCHRNGFRTAVLGLSGGIDSALTAVIAADALGGENVTGIAMPSPYSSDHSLSDAELLAGNLGMPYRVIRITEAMEAFEAMLAEAFEGREEDVTEENIQARIRGVILMALSNKFGSILLTTGNKSEIAVGYATLYGDMAGGFAVLKDVPKTVVYELSRFRNTRGAAIPEGTITKPPSAELKPGQVDEDSLPDYDTLDDIIEAYVAGDCGIRSIVGRGHDPEVVREVIRLIDRAEFKRRQGAPGPKITERAFGKERRVPITNGWRG